MPYWEYMIDYIKNKNNNVVVNANLKVGHFSINAN